MAAQGTQLGSQGKGCTPTPERKDAERGPGDTKLPSYRVLEANDCRVGKPWAQRGVRALRSITVTLWGQKVIMKGESRVFNKEAGVRDTRVAPAVLRGRKTGCGSTVTGEPTQERQRELAQARTCPWCLAPETHAFLSDTRDGPEGERRAVLHDASLGPPGLSVGASVPPTVCVAFGGDLPV